VTDARSYLFVHACHAGAFLESAARGRSVPPVVASEL
jgi:hypothetical protein